MLAPESTGTTAATAELPHAPLLADYDLLLRALRTLRPVSSAPANSTVVPTTNSPMDLICQEGKRAFSALLEDPDYKAECEELQLLEDSLSVSIVEAGTTFTIKRCVGNDRINLALLQDAVWKSRTDRVATVARQLHGQLRADGKVTVGNMAMFYGMAPWDCADSEAHQAAIRHFEEKRATQSLQLEGGVEIDTLLRRATAHDRKTLGQIKRAKPEAAMTMADFLRQVTDAEIVDTIRLALPNSKTSAIDYLLAKSGETPTNEQVRQRPTHYLEKMLRSDEAQLITAALLEKLSWFGAGTQEQASPVVSMKLLSRAIRLWCGAPDETDSSRIAGYAWQQPENYGKSYQAIWHDFERHLLTSKKAQSEREAILLARLYLHKFPSDFHRIDIPHDLPYKRSLVWVNFQHGLNLAELMEPERAAYMSFQQLLSYPLEKAQNASELDEEFSIWCRISPALDWAVATGVLRDASGIPFSTDEQQRALNALDKHTKAMRDAIEQMEVAPPLRVNIANKEVVRALGSIASDPDTFLVLPYHGSDNGIPGFRQVPAFKGAARRFRDVYMADLLEEHQWSILKPDGETQTGRRLEVGLGGKVHIIGKQTMPMPFSLRKLEPLFKTAFDAYLNSTKKAYQVLLESLFCTLPHDALHAMEYGTTRIYTLRGHREESTQPRSDPPLLLRMGFLLRLTHNHLDMWYECLPRVGLIRKRDDLSADIIDDGKGIQKFRVGSLGILELEFVRGKTLPFHWDAFENGEIPKKNASCFVIVEQLGEAFLPETPTGYPLQIATDRATEVATFIAKKFFYHDEEQLYAAAHNETEFEQKEKERRGAGIFKYILPFIGSLEDLKSSDPRVVVMGIFGLIIDIASFAFPIGKFIGGVVRATLMARGIKAALPLYGTLARKLLFATGKNITPIFDAASLLKLGTTALYKGLKYSIKKAFNGLQHVTGRMGSYNVAKGLPQIANVGTYRLLAKTDDLASLDGVDDVLVRKISKTDIVDYRLVDPVSALPYGPRLSRTTESFTPGRSTYRPLDNTDQYTIVELPEGTAVREVLEVDGRTTLYLDDVPYQLDAGELRRFDKIDTSSRAKTLPCRTRRAPGDTCQTNYVARDPAPVPAKGTLDETKGWAPWFGDAIYSPASGAAALKAGTLRNHAELAGSLDFRKGIYARATVDVLQGGQKHTFQQGAVIIESIGGGTHYVFTRLSPGDFYVAELTKSQSLTGALNFKPASKLPKALRDELMTVYTGSLIANNMARIYGTTAVERAMKTMEEIAIPIGGHANPPGTMKLIKVDTSPGEAVLFDHSTRQIVRSSTDGASTWTATRAASEPLRQITKKYFNALFEKEIVTVSAASSQALRIDEAMQRLSNLTFKSGESSGHIRNIAFAEIKIGDLTEVYVSVSGIQNNTGKLPLFARHPGGKAIVDDTTYINIDHAEKFSATALSVSDSGKIRAIPHTIDNIETYTPALTSRPTSLDTESKLIRFIRTQYPDPKKLDSITIATTMAPCDSCSVVMKQFGHDGGPEALNVVWK